MIRKLLSYIREHVIRWKKRTIIRKIEKAMGFRLTEWQIRYIFDNACVWNINRRTGRTTAHIIRLCLSQGEPLEITLPYVETKYLDETHGSAYRIIYGEMLQDIYKKLKKQHLKMRRIIFIRSPTRSSIESRQARSRN